MPEMMDDVASAGVVGVVPAAGYARRMQPLAASKEVLPVRGTPVMDYLMDRMLRAGCTEIRVVTRPEKVDVIDRARRWQASVILGQPATVSASIIAGLAGLPPDSLRRPSCSSGSLTASGALAKGSWHSGR